MNENEKLIFLFNKYEPKAKKKILKRMEKHYKEKTRNETRKIIAKKKLIFKKCMSCNKYSDYLEIHHVDYENPNLIIPLCKRCHGIQHSKKAKDIRIIDLYNYE